MTPQRQLVLDAVRELGHATPEQICAQVQRSAPAVNITTIYRTLDLLERIGLVRHTHLGHGAPTYSEQEHEHVHLVCHRCGTVTEAATDLMDDLADRLRREIGFELDATHIALSGTCSDCRRHSFGVVMSAHEADASRRRLRPARSPPTAATRWPSNGPWPARPPWSTARTAASSPSPVRTG